MTTGTEPAARAIVGYLAARREEVDRALERLLPAGDEWPSVLHRAIRHSVFAGGKRLRPILCLAAAEVFGAAAGDVLEPACGLEMIHTYSLIHDDLPALDNDDLRRGVPTCHVVFGEATAILAGRRAADPRPRPVRRVSRRRASGRGEDPRPPGGRRGDRHAGNDRRPDGRHRGRAGDRADRGAPDAHPREQDRPPHAGLARRRGAPLRSGRSDARAPRRVRPAHRARVPDQGRPARRRVRRGDARQSLEQGRRRRQGDVPRGLGRRSLAHRSCGRTSTRPSRRRRPAAAGQGNLPELARFIGARTS